MGMWQRVWSGLCNCNGPACSTDDEFAAVKAQVLGGRVEPNGLNVSSERVLR